MPGTSLPLQSWCPAEPADVSGMSPPSHLSCRTRPAGGWMNAAAAGASGTWVWAGGRGGGWQGTGWKQKAAARSGGGQPELEDLGGWSPGVLAAGPAGGCGAPLSRSGGHRLAVPPFLMWSLSVQPSVVCQRAQPGGRVSRPGLARGAWKAGGERSPGGRSKCEETRERPGARRLLSPSSRPLPWTQLGQVRSALPWPGPGWPNRGQSIVHPSQSLGPRPPKGIPVLRGESCASGSLTSWGPAA